MMSEEDLTALLRSTLFTLEVLLYGGYDEQSRSAAIHIMDELKGALDEIGAAYDE